LHTDARLPHDRTLSIPVWPIEIISPGGFEDFFRELTTAWGNPEQMSALGARYELDFDFDSVPTLCERFGLTMSRIAN
jgi:hypothetical protein